MNSTIPTCCSWKFGTTIATGTAATRGFKEIDDATTSALRRFGDGETGSSVKNYDIKGKTASQIDSELSAGGWTKDPNSGKLVSKDGKWTKSESVETWTNRDGHENSARMVFYEHQDGGVVRLKPDGVTGPTFPHMQKPHGTKYVKKDPTGGTEPGNEAFKVDGDKAIPSRPNQIDVPAGVDKEAYIRDTWKEPSHVPLEK